MKISRFNHEGYYDPTTYNALTNIIKEQERQERFRPIVYICSPYRGNRQQNTENARRYCRFAVDQGALPIAPHLFFPQFMDDSDSKERDLALFMSYVLLTKCAEIWVFGSSLTQGMTQEIQKAENRGMTIRRFKSNCKEVS